MSCASRLRTSSPTSQYSLSCSRPSNLQETFTVNTPILNAFSIWRDGRPKPTTYFWETIRDVVRCKWKRCCFYLPLKLSIQRISFFLEVITNVKALRIFTALTSRCFSGRARPNCSWRDLTKKIAGFSRSSLACLISCPSPHSSTTKYSACTEALVSRFRTTGTQR